MAAKTIVLTGTHLTPAWALIELLKKNHYRIVYLGRSRSMKGSGKAAAEKQLLTDAGVEFYPLVTLRLPKALVTFPIAVIQALIHLIKLKPKAVVSFGGNVALPVTLAAKLAGVPLVIHEQTFGAGLTNRLTSPLADKIAVSWESSAKFFPPQKTVITGNPLRQAVVAAKRRKRKQGIKTIYITGGNQGSLTINSTVTEILPELLKRYKVYHQFGLTQTESLWIKQSRWAHSLPDNLKKNYRLKRWFNDERLTQILASRPLVIARSGANTVTELSFLGLPAILIPLPIAAKKEQLVNALYLVNRGLALLLPQGKLTPTSLKAAVSQAQKTLPRKVLTGSAPTGLAAKKLYQLVVKAGKRA